MYQPDGQAGLFWTAVGNYNDFMASRLLVYDITIRLRAIKAGFAQSDKLSSISNTNTISDFSSVDHKPADGVLMKYPASPSGMTL